MGNNKSSGIDFNTMPYKYWDDSTKISYLQRKIIINSIMYYELNQSCISDKQYDELSAQLAHLQKSVDKDVLKRTQYYYVMYDFDGSTGFDIVDRLDDRDRKYLTDIVMLVLNGQREALDSDKIKRANQSCVQW